MQQLTAPPAMSSPTPSMTSGVPYSPPPQPRLGTPIPGTTGGLPALSGLSVYQNPMAQQMMAALMAHIADHAAFAYRAQVEMALGVPLPSLDEEENAPIAPEDEKALAPLIAAAAQRTMVQNQAMAAQMQAEQQAAMQQAQMDAQMEM